MKVNEKYSPMGKQLKIGEYKYIKQTKQKIFTPKETSPVPFTSWSALTVWKW